MYSPCSSQIGHKLQISFSPQHMGYKRSEKSRETVPKQEGKVSLFYNPLNNKGAKIAFDSSSKFYLAIGRQTERRFAKKIMFIIAKGNNKMYA